MPPAAWPLLRDLGVADRVRAAGHVRCPGNVAYWGSDQPAEHDFIGDPHGAGCHLDRPLFDADLRSAAVAAGAVVRQGWTFQRARRLPDGPGWRVQFSHGAEPRAVTAAWLIDATGRRALVATQLGVEAEQSDELVAFAALVSNQGDRDARTHIEAVEDGWWYSARVPGNRRVLSFFTDADLPAARDASGPEGFARRLSATRHLRHRAGEMPRQHLERIRRFPAATLARREFGGDGWIAVGDATLAFDPLSSQGMFHALYTGMRGAEIVLECAAGSSEAVAPWAARLRAVEVAYRRHLAGSYARESRWPDSEFWRRRHPAHRTPLPLGDLALASS